MEPNTGSLRCNRTQPLEHSTSTDKENQPTDKDMGTSVFVNHGKSLDLGDLVPKGFIILLNLKEGSIRFYYLLKKKKKKKQKLK